MRKPSRRLFMYRNMKTGEVGLLRACNVDEALEMALDHYNYKAPIEMRSIPRNFKLHIPVWS